MRLKAKRKTEEEISIKPVMDQPESVAEQINKYGTYNIQTTADSGNRFPAIAQGFPRNPDQKRNPESEKTEEKA